MSTDEPHIDCLTTDQFRPEFRLETRTIGSAAADALNVDRPFTIRGITSRGIFVDLDEKLILFLSREHYRGPLTVNLEWDEALIDQIGLRAAGMVCGHTLRFTNPNLYIATGKATLWSALDTWYPTALPDELPVDDQIEKFLIELSSRAHSPNELIAAVAQVLSATPPPLVAEPNDLLTIVTTMHHALKLRDLDKMDQVAHALAGRGRGLTPSGDDFLLGICYGMYMLQARFQDFPLQAGKLLTEKVSRRSTLISANLVACANAGEVDERLGAAFQALLRPQIPADPAIDGILTWGSSSGLDASAGMALLLSAIR